MSVKPSSLKKTAKKESAVLLCLLFFGLLLLPLVVYLIGEVVFGEYGGTGFSAFYGTLHRAFRNGEPAVLFLVLSPYLVWQLSRLTIWGFRQSWRRRQQART